MNKEVISIVVPIYKVEKYIKKCIDSIIKQTYKNLEIILVDDGSPDECGKICDEYAQKDKRIKALLVGQGDMEEETKEAIRLYGMEKYIRTSPFRSDVPDVLHAIDVFCLPSLWEGLSIALLEAMAMKKALVVTPTDGTKEVITHQQSGLIVDFGKPEELAECYLAYLHHPEWKEDYGVTAMSTIQERFNSRRVSQQVTEVYYDILR